jgi:hypothetical protein
MPFDELPNGEGWIAAALPSALYLVSQLDRQRVEMWKTALRRGTLEWQLWAGSARPYAKGGKRPFAAVCAEVRVSDEADVCSCSKNGHCYRGEAVHPALTARKWQGTHSEALL